MPQKRSRKSVLPPRVPAFGILPGLQNVDFANPTVVEILRRAGWKPGRASRRSNRQRIYDEAFSEILAEPEIDREIRTAVQFYLLERMYAEDPKHFRTKLGKFAGALRSFVSKIPSRDSPLEAALKREWMRQHTEDLPCLACNKVIDPELVWDLWLGFDRLKANLREYEKLVEKLQFDESGAGRDADRPAHTLVGALGRVFAHYTGKEPTRKYDASALTTAEAVMGDFGEFVKAINHLNSRSI